MALPQRVRRCFRLSLAAAVAFTALCGCHGRRLGTEPGRDFVRLSVRPRRLPHDRPPERSCYRARPLRHQRTWPDRGGHVVDAGKQSGFVRDGRGRFTRIRRPGRPGDPSPQDQQSRPDRRLLQREHRLRVGPERQAARLSLGPRGGSPASTFPAQRKRRPSASTTAVRSWASTPTPTAWSTASCGTRVGS